MIKNKKGKNQKVNLPIKDEADLAYIRQEAKNFAEENLFDLVDQTRIVTAVSEITRNAYVFAKTGKITFLNIKGGIEIIVSDNGPGIKNLELCFEDGYSTQDSLGIGLPGAKRLMDDFQIETSAGKGTKITMRKYI